MNKVFILWTGGFDSTYRMIELSRMDVIVHPIYIHGDERASERIELQAIETITQLLRDNCNTKAVIEDIELVDKASIPINDEITKAYAVIKAKTNLGSQHEFLARYAYDHSGLELGTEKGQPETSHIIDAIRSFGVLKKKAGTYALDSQKSSKEGMLVLGNFSFPIIDKYETEMMENLRKWGYMDVISNIWFCHNPIDGKPCGFCHPCSVKMESNMEELLPKDAQKRYYKHRTMKKVFGERVANSLFNTMFRK